MTVNLICSENIKPILLGILCERNISIDEQADICIVEAGCPVPTDKLCMVFPSDNLFVLMELLNKLTKPNDNDKIIGRFENERYIVMSFDQIFYFEARGNYTFCITEDGEYKVKEKLYELEARLPQIKFIRVGKSFIANIENVKEIVPWFGRRLILKFAGSKREIEVSKNYVKSFKEFLGL